MNPTIDVMRYCNVIVWAEMLEQQSFSSWATRRAYGS